MTNRKFIVPEIDVELDGYDDYTEGGTYTYDRVSVLRGALSKYIENYGIPPKGMHFWDGNLSVRLDNVLFAYENEKAEVYFSFSVPS